MLFARGSVGRLARRFVVYSFTVEAVLVYAVYMIILREAGLSFIQISALMVMWAASVAVLEFPSGVLADLWSRRAVAMIGLWAKAAAFVVWFFWPHFWGFAVGFFLWGIQEAFCSGAVDACAYDALAELGARDQFGRMLSLARVAMSVSIALAVAAGGYFYARFGNWVMLLSIVPTPIAVWALAGIPDRAAASADASVAAPTIAHGPAEPDGPQGLRAFLREVQSALLLPGVAVFVLLGTLYVAIPGSTEEFDQLFGLHVGVPLAAIGVWGASRHGAEAVGRLLAPRLSAAGALGTIPGLFVAAALSGVLLMAAVFRPHGALLVSFFLYYSAAGAISTVFEEQLHHRIPSAVRASVVSFASLLMTVFAMVAMVLFGFAAERLGIVGLYALGATGSMAVGAAGYLIMSGGRGIPNAATTE